MLLALFRPASHLPSFLSATVRCSSILSSLRHLLPRVPRALHRLQQVSSHLPFFGTALPSLLVVRAMSSNAAAAGTDLPAFPQTDAEWRQKLNGAEYAVLRQKDTEGRNVGYTNEEADGTYVCKGCSAPLYESKTKFHSGCGWPAFWDGIPGAIKRVPDADGHRVEILCARCDSHLGHVFTGEAFGNPKVRDARSLTQSLSLRLSAADRELLPAPQCASALRVICRMSATASTASASNSTRSERGTLDTGSAARKRSRCREFRPPHSCLCILTTLE